MIEKVSEKKLWRHTFSAWCALEFFKFMKISGWLALFAMLISHFLTAPFTGNGWLQVYFDIVIILITVVSRLEGRLFHRRHPEVVYVVRDGPVRP